MKLKNHFFLVINKEMITSCCCCSHLMMNLLSSQTDANNNNHDSFDCDRLIDLLIGIINHKNQDKIFKPRTKQNKEKNIVRSL